MLPAVMSCIRVSFHQVVAIQESIDLVSLPSSKQLTLVEDAQPLMLMAEAHTFKDNKPCKVSVSCTIRV